MGSGSSKPDGPIQITDHVARIGFPQTMHMTWLKSWSKIAIHIAAPDSQPLYSISMPVGYGGHTVLHPGPGAEAPPMAYITRKGSNFTFNLPGVPSSGLAPCEVGMACEHPHTEVRYRFSMTVWHQGGQRTEVFEWRRSRGDQVKALGGSRNGWKLVRMGTGANVEVLAPFQEFTAANPVPARKLGDGQAATPGYAKDGYEVVAVFSEAKTFSMSMMDVGRFQYVGSGAAQAMGYHWALMAVLSGMCVFQHQMARQTNATGSTAAASAAGAAVGAAVGV